MNETLSGAITFWHRLKILSDRDEAAHKGMKLFLWDVDIQNRKK